jgi:alkyl sulfatase BDS1-like metallo-beta-lactamase superfamily hydrolase
MIQTPWQHHPYVLSAMKQVVAVRVATEMLHEHSSPRRSWAVRGFHGSLQSNADT